MAAQRVLVVDDEIHIVRVLERRLKAAGYEVHIARDGAAAVEAVAAFRPDLIFLDQQMPRMSGLEAARALAATGDPARAPIVMLSGRCDLVPEAERPALRIVRTVSKPFSATELLEIARSLFAEEAAKHPPGEAA